MADEVVHSENAPFLVLFGSQTGTAAEVAEMIGRQARRRGFKPRVCAMDSYDIRDLLKETMVVFVVATTGQGVEPDNMVRTWRFLLRKGLPTDSLCGLRSAVFGLGDSSYPKFNFVGKKLHKRLKQLGSKPIVPLGLADDQHDLGVDGALDPWLQGLWSIVSELHPLKPGTEVVPDQILLPPKYNIEVLSVDSMDSTGGCLPYLQQSPADNPKPSAAKPFRARVLSNTRITSETHFQDVRHVTLDIKNSGIVYSPGDVVQCMPENNPEVVSELLDWLNWDGEATILVSQREGGPVVPYQLCKDDEPSPISLRNIMTHYLDVGGRPRRYFFELLSHFAGDPRAKEKFQEFNSARGQEDLFAYCYRPRRTFLEVLQDFPSTKGCVPLEYLFDLFGPLQPRAFSISSAPLVHPGELHLTVAIVDYKTILAKRRCGVFTSFLRRMDLTAGPVHIPIWCQRGTFKFPPPSTSVIAIGPGTGCAPFRSLLFQRCQEGARGDMFIFGNRNVSGDYLHQEDWDRLAQESDLQVVSAFSRDQEDKIYVQHRIVENGAKIWAMINDGAIVCLAGNAKRMPIDVRDALEEITCTHGGQSAQEAQDYWKQLERQGRFQEETWS